MTSLNRRRFLQTTALAGVGVALAGCGGDDGGDGGDGGSGGVKSGGTFVTTISSNLESKAPTNPFAVPTVTFDTYNSLTLGYAKNSLTDPNQFYPGLAESWEIADDQSEVTIHLQPKAKWSDGEAVTADDVVFSYKIAYTRGAGAFILTPGAAGTVGEVEVVDDQTLKFTQDPENPTNTFARGIMNLIVVPEHVWKDVLPADFDQTLETAQGEGEAATAAAEKITKISEDVMAFKPEEDVNAGPFVFERGTPSELLYTKNKNFFAVDNIAPDKLIVKNFNGNQQIWDFLKNGSIDNAPFTAVPPDVMDQFRANENIEISASYSPVVAGLAFNQSVEPYNDLHVRKALAYLIDRDQAIEVATPEGGKAPIGTSGMHSDALNEWFGGDAEGALDLEPYAQDSAKAEAELTEAGFTKDGDKWLLPNGKPWKVTLQVVNGFTDWIAFGENVVSQLKEFGIDAQTKTSPDFDVYQAEMAEGKYEMGFWLLGITPSPFDVYSRIYGQTNGWTILGNKLSHAAPGEGGNWMGGPETYDVDGEQVNPGELTLSLRTATQDEMPDAIAKLAKITNQNLPVIQMWDYVNTQFFVTKNYEGFPSDKDDALRLRAGVWMMQGWITKK